MHCFLITSIYTQKKMGLASLTKIQRLKQSIVEYTEQVLCKKKKKKKKAGY